MTNYFLNEHFYSMQGEGVHTGRAAYFLRLQGCDQQCPFCDSAGTWHPNWKPENVLRATAEEAADLVKAADGAFVVITGGEPALYDLEPLVEAIHLRGFKAHLETAGHRFIRGAFDWITLSPKLFAAPPIESSWLNADEVKLIVTSPEQLERDLETILAAPLRPRVPIWLHPEWSQRNNAALLYSMIEAVKENARLRAGWQLHKLFSADTNDANASRVIVPLGGVA